MRILLDTHAALWWWENSPSLGGDARDAIGDPANEVYFSAASGYEIFQKVRLGRLKIPATLHADLPAAVLEEGWKLLSLTVQEARAAALIDHSHRDPFDRMLAAQVQLGDLKIASVDLFFTDLGIPTIW